MTKFYRTIAVRSTLRFHIAPLEALIQHHFSDVQQSTDMHISNPSSTFGFGSDSLLQLDSKPQLAIAALNAMKTSQQGSIDPANY
jgi:hypothetical protein